MMNELMVFLVGATPVLEVQGAIPLGLGVFKFSLLKTYVLSVAGSMLPIIPGLLFLHYASEYAMHRWYWANRLLSWVFQYTRDRHSNHFQEKPLEHAFHHQWTDFWKVFALFAFVATPLPFAGVWSGIVAAFVFGFPFWRSVLALALGTITAGLIVLLVSSPLA